MERVETLKLPAMPMSQIVYGEIVYWVTIAAALIVTIGPTLALIFTDNNVLNPYGTFTAIFGGASPEEIWAASRTGGFPGGHFYFGNLMTGDGFTQLGVALGCAVALPGLVGSFFAFVREKSWVFVGLSVWVAFLIFISASGLISLH